MIKLENISKIYKFDDVVIEALKDVSLTIEKGEFVAIMGASGSGKSTLLNIIGCMDTATSGTYTLDNDVISKLNSNGLSKIRNSKITFVFQNFALMEKYTAYENIELPLVNRKVSFAERRKRVSEIAKQLGIEAQLDKLPKQMSGGQQQRIALARALVSGADIILADEPTGALDQKTGIELMELLRNLNKDGKTIILVTHDPIVASYAKRIITILDGRISQ
ncbi:putative ABC transport system ATP-binding protein [Keratinibaculum paraultunense]|uniref:Putative ABC transport system ATP-binding protein n=1 Tax=Keratinibaculum paraultunense TaxID=1278232 RepID=A0A4R3KSM0_9FIRM|nr:ABC transporter ATP-binding protein [Keratinibaculum paraultunense]QQY79455.1 ABC transporter ATP-binding protein [Keratinibaculum paraultunense]TCS88052.1 putative ABC transport system ATP-binding protein [Keratinibaculum paraultunense]